MFKTKEKARGYNQSLLLAKSLSNKLHIPIATLTEKLVDNLNQASLGHDERLNNVKNVYSIVKSNQKLIKDKTILLIDDVMTTGATSNEICKLLLSKGAKACYVLVLCHGKRDILPTTTSN